MKTYIKLLVLAFTLTFAGSALYGQEVNTKQNTQKGPKQKSIKTLKVQITGMTCAHGCAAGIQDAVYRKKGVKSSDVDFNSGIGTFVYDESKITKEDIIKTIVSFNPGESGGAPKYSAIELK